ncbi:MAG: M20/M25/M40 family metallo-hydrolase [Actinomycetota bacterium]|nr:M20/M25/M40 family metallo-hydrolase [Actinomycetota bacterium]
MPLTLDDFERDALATLTTYATIECLSPAFDAHWHDNGHLDAAIELLAQWARQRTLQNFKVDVVRIADRTPVLVVTVEATNDDEATVVLYGHMDKQPPLGDWSEGLSPYAPVRRDDRLFARGVADDGYSTFAALMALESLEARAIPHGRCVVLIEACEESGSPDLEAYLDHLSDHLGRVELMICLDSGALTYDRLWVTTSLRGLVGVELTVQVLTRGQHSGSASGVVPSSFRILRQLLDRVEDAATGEILVEELHGAIPDAAQFAAREIAREFGDQMYQDLPVVENLALMGDGVAERILNQTWRPTLSLVAMAGLPSPESAGNVLRPFTTALLSFRLPPNVDAARARAALERVLTRDVPEGAHVSVRGHGADGWSSPAIAPWLERALEQASQEFFGNGVGYTGEGGTIPFLASLGRRYPGVQFVATGVLGPDSNAHGIDEMLDLPTCVALTNVVANVVEAFSHRKDAS